MQKHHLYAIFKVDVMNTSSYTAISALRLSFRGNHLIIVSFISAHSDLQQTTPPYTLVF